MFFKNLKSIWIWFKISSNFKLLKLLLIIMRSIQIFKVKLEHIKFYEPNFKFKNYDSVESELFNREIKAGRVTCVIYLEQTSLFIRCWSKNGWEIDKGVVTGRAGGGDIRQGNVMVSPRVVCLISWAWVEKMLICMFNLTHFTCPFTCALPLFICIFFRIIMCLVFSISNRKFLCDFKCPTPSNESRNKIWTEKWTETSFTFLLILITHLFCANQNIRIISCVQPN